MKRQNMSNADYHAAAGISSSDFRLLELSPLHYENKNLFRLEGSHFDLGSLVHAMVLTPNTVLKEFAPEDFEGCDLDKRTNAYKEAKKKWLSSVGDRTVIPKDVWDQAQRMADNVKAIAGNLFENGQAEESFFVEDDLFEVTRKCRPDYYREDLGIVIDLKTTKDGSAYGFGKSIYDYRYHRQAAWYLSTLQMAGKQVDKFIFVTVETSKPFMVAVWEIDEASIVAGKINYERLLMQWQQYKRSGVASVVHPIGIPDWALAKEV